MPLVTPITKLLVANRGEIASRVIRSARTLDIATVAVFSDADATAPFVAEADEAVRLPGVTPAETYLRADRLISAAVATGADAVHPGYGFLSERAEFARACTEAGLIFVGPSARAIEAMGSKIAAKELMGAAGVPVLPGMTIGDAPDLLSDLAARAAEEVGFPLLVKAAHGGGGRGMRVVQKPADLLDAVVSARREAEAAFGNGAVFLERYVADPRHIEVQIFGDTHGHVVHLFERECSIQRRYQKIIEEAPSPAIDETLRGALGEAGVAAGRAIDYVGAGTVEFVMDADRRFYFLEVNTRLQVEHPVTEFVTGIDLVRLQLLVAEGRPLPMEVMDARISGHAIEARLYAEDVSAGYLPAPGIVHRFSVPEMPGVRVDAGVADGSSIGVHYDPMLAKVIAHGATRDEARRLLASALHRTLLHGVTNNRDLLVAILREPEFVAGDIDTGFLVRHDATELSLSQQHAGADRLHALAAALAGQAERRASASVLATVPSGWRNVAGDPQQTTYTVSGVPIDVQYRLDRSGLFAKVDGEVLGDASLLEATDTQVVVEVDGVRRAIAVHRVGAVVYVDSTWGATVLVEEPRFPDAGAFEVPGSLLAPMPGTVVRINVEPGQLVTSGSVVVVLEAMKMEQTVVAPHDGRVVEVGVVLHQSVDVGTVLAVVEREEKE
jgi:acetyl/propionyl-CoA carboxylase alpha subunit